MKQNILIKPKKLSGNLKAIPSKSYGHRMIILSAISQKPSQLILDEYNEDLKATLGCIEELGGRYEILDNILRIYPIKKRKQKPILNAKESGSTLRFIIPIATAIYECNKIVAEGSLNNRPVEELTKALEKKGVYFKNHILPLETSGKFTGGEIEIEGNISSQYISGILLSAPLFKEDTRIKLRSGLESKSYVDITIDVLENYGINVTKYDNGFFVKGNQVLNPREEMIVEGDWSNASPFLIAGALGGLISLTGLNFKSVQGDKVILEILKEFGAKVEVTNRVLVTSKDKKPFKMDINEFPDLLPVLSILSCGAEGKSIFTGCHRLKLKESDRLNNTKRLINCLGGNAEVINDALIVHGKGFLEGGKVQGFNDHRMVMAASIASVIAKNEIEIEGAEAINKSYPRFFKDLKKLGGDLIDFDYR
ncbi:MAG: 3-phosphoshikimate 1-carboxyvinyltransferase [Lagierella massiliensis]|nr:3-phosphoshikimate 1-carboxyvinyltransferase [Lagierella massiliensis]